MKCQGEWNCHFFLFVTFVVLTVDHFAERVDGGPFELQKQDSNVFGKACTFLEIC